ncbi:serine hydrolase domain-containing protein [Mycolicibacterium tusciae]|uniref:serine hydrolase domain-containing protein n=1 Tax=Mycolicibacterium tusciae TaxID=75922 RepID=UPI00024A2954|nr:serine hydrolase domain-containing protein [Mycolicibacterium tusciae]
MSTDAESATSGFPRPARETAVAQYDLAETPQVPGSNTAPLRVTRTRLSAIAGAAVLGVGVGMGATGCTFEPAGAEQVRFEPAALQAALNSVQRAGMPGIHAEVRSGDERWRGAAGVADLETGVPMRPEMRQRIGSITKTFTAAAVMQQVEQGRIRLDAPVGDYLPDLVPGERGRQITVRMLLNHTSGLAEYLPRAFPSLGSFPDPAGLSPESLDDNRFTEFGAAELIGMGVAAPATGAPGETPGMYSNTNYLLLGELLADTTGIPAEEYITANVIERAGLRDTGFPAGPAIEGPHPRMYESLFGKIDPPRDYSVYTMSWVMPGAGLVSTTEDLNLFYRKLLAGEIVTPSSLAQMQQTVRVVGMDGEQIDYGLGLHRVEVSGCGTFWGHDGTVFGALTSALTRADGARQVSIAMNLMRWNRLDAAGVPQPHPIDAALDDLHRRAMCG